MSPDTVANSRISRLIFTAGLILALLAGLFGVFFLRPAAPALAGSPTQDAPLQTTLLPAAGHGRNYGVRRSRAAVLVERQRLPLASAPSWVAAVTPDDFASRRQLRAGVLGDAARQQQAALEAFAASMQMGEADAVTGVWVPGLLALPVRQQPAGDPDYVSSTAGELTQFSLARALGTTGLLAHNDRAGAAFFALSPGQAVYLVYGDGVVKEYRVSAIRRYKAEQPNSPFSDFLNLDEDQESLTAEALFYQVYQAEDRVVFQTCIEEFGISTWGRLFVIATPAGT